MKTRKIASFHQNIRRMFIRYAIVPVFLVAVCCLGLCIFIWNYSITQSSAEANDAVAQKIEEVFQVYGDEAAYLAKEAALVGNFQRPSIDCLVEIKRQMYSCAEQTGYQVSLYVLNEKLEHVICDQKESEDVLFLEESPCYDWGILGRIARKPYEVSLYLSSKEESMLYIGTGILASGRLSGYVVIGIPQTEFEVLLTEVAPQTIVTDSNGWIYLSNSFLFQDVLGRMERSIANKSGFFRANGQWYYMSKQGILNDALSVYTISNQDMPRKMFTLISVFSFAVFLAIVLLTYRISGKMAGHSTYDISRIAEAFEQVKDGNLDQKLDIRSCKEFQEIGDDFNLMLDGLKQDMKDKKELAEHIAFAQVKQLEAQFHPHFLFNTLDNIRFMARIDVDAADKMIVALSSLLRYSISNASEEITVDEDLFNTQSYLTILKIRFNKRFTYTIDVEEQVKFCLIPKLLFQPLIENAVKYGYASKDCLHVSIKGYRDGMNLMFVCEDNGTGMKKEVLEEIRYNLTQPENKTSHLGIYNIHRRIQLLYHKDYGVSIESEEGIKTVLTLKLPFHTE